MDDIQGDRVNFTNLIFFHAEAQKRGGAEGLLMFTSATKTLRHKVSQKKQIDFEITQDKLF